MFCPVDVGRLDGCDRKRRPARNHPVKVSAIPWRRRSPTGQKKYRYISPLSWFSFT
jgi:hypothetical protein